MVEPPLAYFPHKCPIRCGLIQPPPTLFLWNPAAPPPGSPLHMQGLLLTSRLWIQRTSPSAAHHKPPLLPMHLLIPAKIVTGPTRGSGRLPSPGKAAGSPCQWVIWSALRLLPSPGAHREPVARKRRRNYCAGLVPTQRSVRRAILLCRFQRSTATATMRPPRNSTFVSFMYWTHTWEVVAWRPHQGCLLVTTAWAQGHPSPQRQASRPDAD